VRYIMSGGQFLDGRLVMRLCERLPNTRIVNMYGASENSPRISYHWVEDQGSDDPARFYPVGIPVQGTRMEIRSDDDGPVPVHEVGEVVVGGTSLMRGYWRDAEATTAKLRNGWLHTGDLGYLDEGNRLVLTGRASNVINVGNEKVSPEDIERVLLEVKGVAEAGVFGVADPVTGESVRAKVVVEAGAAVEPETMLQHCRLMVSGYKVPREIRIVDALPRTLYGKLDRTKLKES
jgi:acyl-CoA synthetase (AMP-forming)/AMP-acid ligase II